jgi:L-lysine exporter family protein LysE/ArgO
VLDPVAGGSARLGPVLATSLALTWLNPHVWLDTVLLIGTVATRWPGQGVAFWLGATAASFTFFFGLGFGARLLRPLFARPAAWRWLDIGVGVVMWVLAVALVTG